MKPFNLKKALAGHPLVTRSGRVVTGFRVQSNPLDSPYPYAVFARGISGILTYTSKGKYLVKTEDPFDLFMADVPSPIPTKPRPKSETRKNVERVRVIMNRGNWMTLDRIGEDLYSRYGVNLPEQSVSARVRDLRKDQYGNYDIRRKQVGKGLYAYKNFGKKGVKA